MSTPINPPGGGPPAAADAASEQAGAADEIDGAEEFSSLVEGAKEPSSVGSLGEVPADLSAGHIDPEQAVERLVERALQNAAGLPESERAALESQLRDALREDPTLLALQKDLQRASNA